MRARRRCVQSALSFRLQKDVKSDRFSAAASGYLLIVPTAPAQPPAVPTFFGHRTDNIVLAGWRFAACAPTAHPLRNGVVKYRRVHRKRRVNALNDVMSAVRFDDDRRAMPAPPKRKRPAEFAAAVEARQCGVRVCLPRVSSELKGKRALPSRETPFGW